MTFSCQIHKLEKSISQIHKLYLFFYIFMSNVQNRKSIIDHFISNLQIMKSIVDHLVSNLQIKTIIILICRFEPKFP